MRIPDYIIMSGRGCNIRSRVLSTIRLLNQDYLSKNEVDLLSLKDYLNEF